MYQVGYWTELAGVTLDDPEQMVSTFQAMPYGEYEHPVYGKINFDQQKAAEAAEGVNAKVRGTDLDIDYDHKQYGGEASGWVKKAEARSDGLYLTVEWTSKAWDLIKNKAYRYFSPEFADEWTHPKTKKTFKNVLFGGAITNRPFLKDILPLNMSELFAEQQTAQEGTGMDPKKLRKLLGLPEDATDEAVEAALQERPPAGEGGEGGSQDNGDSGNGEGGQDNAGESGAVAASEAGLTAEVIQLAEKSPAIKALVDSVTALHKTVETQQAALQLSEVNATVMKLSEPVNGKTLPPSVQEELKKALLTPNAENVVKFAETLTKTGFVELGERGKAGDQGGGDGTDAAKKFSDAVQKVVDQDKLSYADATERVASLQPELFEAYRQSSYAFREN